MQSYVNSTQYQYPEMASAFVDAIDEKQRNNTIRNIADRWLKTDPKKAETWLNQTTLPQDQKDKLLNSVKK